MATTHQPLSFMEKAGYSAGDAAANLVFMTMILFQLNFYTDVFGLSANTAAAILLWPRLWDAIFDPVMGVLADRTNTRWGKFRPWILWTSVPWAVVMILAYTAPDPAWGWSTGMVIAYAGITNTLLMTLYSMNNMPYSALGGVMTADLNERTKLNSYRFVSVNVAQFAVGGLTLPLVAKFAQGADRAHGWQVTMTIWAVACLVLFMVTFFSTKERIKPIVETKSSPKQDFLDLLKNGPWIALVAYTLFHFALLALRGGAHYNYYHHYADKAAMFDFLEALGLTTADAQGFEQPGRHPRLHRAWHPRHDCQLQCGRCVQQHRQHGGHRHDHHRHHAVGRPVGALRQAHGGHHLLRAVDADGQRPLPDAARPPSGAWWACISWAPSSTHPPAPSCGPCMPTRPTTPSGRPAAASPAWCSPPSASR